MSHDTGRYLLWNRQLNSDFDEIDAETLGLLQGIGCCLLHLLFFTVKFYCPSRIILAAVAHVCSSDCKRNVNMSNLCWLLNVGVTFLGPKMGFWPLGLSGPPSHVWEEGNLGYEPTRDPPAGGDLGVGSQLEGARSRSQVGRTWCCACLS